MDSPQQGQLSQEQLLSRQPNPFTKGNVVWDTAECHADEEISLERLTSVGFEPYAITPAPETRPEVIRQAQLKNSMAMRLKIWLKRPRCPEDTPLTEKGSV